MENVKKFYEALTKDTAMQERAKKLTDSFNSEDEAEMIAATVGFAEKEGYSLTADDVKAYIAETPKRELSDEQLENVAGGAFEDTRDEFTVCPRCKSKNRRWENSGWWIFKIYWNVCNNCGYDGRSYNK